MQEVLSIPIAFGSIWIRAFVSLPAETQACGTAGRFVAKNRRGLQNITTPKEIGAKDKIKGRKIFLT
jgi:hypothetical protein